MTIKKDKICCICGNIIKGEVYKKGKKTYCEECMEQEDVDWFDWCCDLWYCSGYWSL